MQAYWEMFQSMDTWIQVFWGCAVIGSIIFIVQMVLTLVGMDSSDMDVDFDGADTMDLGGGISLFSIKNFVNFIVGFGWGGVCFAGVIENKWLLTLVAVLVGVAFVLMFFFIKKQTKKLEHNGAFQISDCVAVPSRSATVSARPSMSICAFLLPKAVRARCRSASTDRCRNWKP